ncbi:hypothetical protein E4T39_03029 [Aureobasidium subglaciale]|nr:hypothetical protein E4T39_03029 [Aureobasidium subglaciale]
MNKKTALQVGRLIAISRDGAQQAANDRVAQRLTVEAAVQGARLTTRMQKKMKQSDVRVGQK